MQVSAGVTLAASCPLFPILVLTAASGESELRPRLLHPLHSRKLRLPHLPSPCPAVSTVRACPLASSSSATNSPSPLPQLRPWSQPYHQPPPSTPRLIPNSPQCRSKAIPRRRQQEPSIKHSCHLQRIMWLRLSLRGRASSAHPSFRMRGNPYPGCCHLPLVEQLRASVLYCSPSRKPVYRARSNPGQPLRQRDDEFPISLIRQPVASTLTLYRAVHATPMRPICPEMTAKNTGPVNLST